MSVKEFAQSDRVIVSTNLAEDVDREFIGEIIAILRIKSWDLGTVQYVVRPDPGEDQVSDYYALNHELELIP